MLIRLAAATLTVILCASAPVLVESSSGGASVQQVTAPSSGVA